MGDIKLSISIKEENNILFKRCVRKLLDSTFIVGDKDEKLYSFVIHIAIIFFSKNFILLSHASLIGKIYLIIFV